MSWSGKTVWLVGASEGIGECLAEQLIQAGARVAISARNQTKLEAIAARFSASQCMVVSLDVTDNASVEQAWAKLTSTWPQIDLMIYNAGTYDSMDAQHYDLKKLEAMLDVNFRGACRVLSLILPPFIARKSGHIALVASVAAYRGLPVAIGYGASKAALLHLAENLKADLINSGVKVQVISPGFVDTRLTQKNDFKMPALQTPQRAASIILEGLSSACFEIHFPKRFTLFMKLLGLMPANLYFWLLSKMKVKS